MRIQTGKAYGSVLLILKGMLSSLWLRVLPAEIKLICHFRPHDEYTKSGSDRDNRCQCGENAEVHTPRDVRREYTLSILAIGASPQKTAKYLSSSPGLSYGGTY